MAQERQVEYEQLYRTNVFFHKTIDFLLDGGSTLDAIMQLCLELQNERDREAKEMMSSTERKLLRLKGGPQDVY